MKVTKLKTADLVVNEGQIEGVPSNPRQWTRGELTRLKKSLQETPELFEARGILVYPHGGKYIVIGGNMRLSASKELGLKEVPCIVIPEDTPAEKLRELVIKDNGAFGQWDFDMLANEWDDLPLTEWGVPAWEGETSGASAEAKEDDFDEDTDAIEVVCKKGDVWELGEHRLMCGDSIDLEQVKTLMGGALADMVFTDPPYGVSYTDKNEFLNRLGASQRLTKPIENDSHTPQEMFDFWGRAFSNMADVSKKQMTYYITSPQGGELLLLQAINETPFALKHMLIWNKNNHVLGRCDYNYKHEPILYGWKKEGTHKFYGASSFKTTVWDIAKPQKNDLHPTMKPVELVSACLLDGSKEGDAVLDLFGGSGTTLIACEQLHRKCYTMEIDPHYCDIIIARWEKLTNKKAKRILPME